MALQGLTIAGVVEGVALPGGAFRAAGADRRALGSALAGHAHLLRPALLVIDALHALVVHAVFVGPVCAIAVHHTLHADPVRATYLGSRAIAVVLALHALILGAAIFAARAMGAIATLRTKMSAPRGHADLAGAVAVIDAISTGIGSGVAELVRAVVIDHAFYTGLLSRIAIPAVAVIIIAAALAGARRLIASIVAGAIAVADAAHAPLLVAKGQAAIISAQTLHAALILRITDLATGAVVVVAAPHTDILLPITERSMGSGTDRIVHTFHALMGFIAHQRPVAMAIVEALPTDRGIPAEVTDLVVAIAIAGAIKAMPRGRVAKSPSAVVVLHAALPTFPRIGVADLVARALFISTTVARRLWGLLLLGGAASVRGLVELSCRIAVGPRLSLSRRR